MHNITNRKSIFVNAIGAGPNDTLLDLAGGTGGISFLALERGAGRVILTDVNPAMLEVAQGRALSRGLVSGLSFMCVDAERIPLPDRSVERVSIAFGLRNCTDKDAVLHGVCFALVGAFIAWNSQSWRSRRSMRFMMLGPSKRCP
jgi:ubiquinone/menaquinone biosynthesis C-methylase UbiE